MKKTMLIAPFDGPHADALAAEARAAGWTVALALPSRSPGTAGGAAEGRQDEDGVAAFPYNPASFVSVSALVMAAHNALGEIDAAVLVADPQSFRPDFVQGKPGELAAMIEARCSGPLFVAREAVKRFEARRAGRILLLSPEPPRDAALGPAASLASGAFLGLGNGLFSASTGAPWCAYGVQDASGQPERAARLALDLLADEKRSKAGKWIKFTGKTGIFGF